MPSLVRNDIDPLVQQYMGKRTPVHRFSSFDYCYRYFYATSKEQIINDMEKSCLVLGFYLASWGMFRGKSSLLQRSVKYYEAAIEYISTKPKECWDIDVCCGAEDNIDQLMDIYEDLRARLASPSVSHLILVTKVMLGVFGTVPAFDRYFTDAFRSIVPGAGFRTFSKKSLTNVLAFYSANKSVIDQLSNEYEVLAFSGGEHPTIKYPRAKIVDMYGFMVGGGRNET